MGRRPRGPRIHPAREPWRNGYAESFHSRQLEQFLNINTLTSVLQALVELTGWHHDYNHIRRHLTQAWAKRRLPTMLISGPQLQPNDSQSARAENSRQATLTIINSLCFSSVSAK
jgi:putative transposase